MKMLNSFSGSKNEFCLFVIQFKNAASTFSLSNSSTLSFLKASNFHSLSTYLIYVLFVHILLLNILLQNPTFFIMW